MRSTAASILCWLVVSPALYACPIPVFRYALEFWEPDAYELEILHRGPLSAEAKAAAGLLTEYAADEDVTVNLVVRFTDAARTPPDAVADREPFLEPGAARLTVRRPGDDGKRDRVWDVTLTPDAIERVVDSPARRETARRLLDGESAVWVLVESGDRQADEAAAELLQEQLELLEATLKLPEALVNQAGRPALAESRPEVRLSFSMLRIADQDAAEAFFATTLTGFPGHRANAQVPVVVPVFGRGRALDPLAGDEINKANINRAARFLIGPCSCQAKALNPGRDLLMKVDWETELGGSLLEIIDLPPLVSLSTLADAAADGETEVTPTPGTLAASAVSGQVAAASPQASSNLTRNLLIALALVVLVVGFLVLRVMRQSTKNHP